MSNWQQDLYDRTPWVFKEGLVALEAWRRNRYRRFGEYEQIKKEYDLARYQELSAEEIKIIQFAKLQKIISEVRAHSAFYRSRLPETLLDLGDLSQIPILTKADLRAHQSEMIADNYPPRWLWKSATSGSTGTPLRILVGREGIRARFAIQDNYYAQQGCPYGARRVRFGGSRIAPAAKRTPPFWILNWVDHQLQMSPYHMDQTTLPLYIRKINEFEPIYITGYAHAIYILAQYVLEHGGFTADIRAVFVDSEGIPAQYIEVIEAGLKTHVFQTYGIGETGWIAVQASDSRYHVLELSCILEVVDDNDQPLPYGQSGRLVVSDLTQWAVPYLRYDTGDIGTLLPATSDSNMHSLILDSIDGRSDEFVITPQGRRVGRLSHVSKPGKGILESQIVQTALDRVEIRVVAATDFDETSMTQVIEVARQLLGDAMVIEWKRVESIPRTNRHKFKHVIREF